MRREVLYIRGSSGNYTCRCPDWSGENEPVNRWYAIMVMLQSNILAVVVLDAVSIIEDGCFFTLPNLYTNISYLLASPASIKCKQFCYACSPVGERVEGNCVFTQWTAWGSCSVTCDQGTQVRKRRVASVEADGADFFNCTGQLTELRVCINLPCGGRVYYYVAIHMYLPWNYVLYINYLYKSGTKFSC